MLAPVVSAMAPVQSTHERVVVAIARSAAFFRDCADHVEARRFGFRRRRVGRWAAILGPTEAVCRAAQRSASKYLGHSQTAMATCVVVRGNAGDAQLLSAAPCDWAHIAVGAGHVSGYRFR